MWYFKNANDIKQSLCVCLKMYTNEFKQIQIYYYKNTTNHSSRCSTKHGLNVSPAFTLSSCLSVNNNNNKIYI